MSLTGLFNNCSANMIKSPKNKKKHQKNITKFVDCKKKAPEFLGAF